MVIDYQKEKNILERKISLRRFHLKGAFLKRYNIQLNNTSSKSIVNYKFEDEEIETEISIKISEDWYIFYMAKFDLNKIKYRAFYNKNKIVVSTNILKKLFEIFDLRFDNSQDLVSYLTIDRNNIIGMKVNSKVII